MCSAHGISSVSIDLFPNWEFVTHLEWACCLAAMFPIQTPLSILTQQSRNSDDLVQQSSRVYPSIILDESSSTRQLPCMRSDMVGCTSHTSFAPGCQTCICLLSSILFLPLIPLLLSCHQASSVLAASVASHLLVARSPHIHHNAIRIPREGDYARPSLVYHLRCQSDRD